ncbi:MAG: LLM class flavin-dependent oxidoreductase [Candidatus Rokubacteria bacterium]|nr:LLM class flavin-dependent oxidoreductase [Candidatus Rokubacteria bacterium]
MRTGLYFSVERLPGQTAREVYEAVLAQAAMADELGFDSLFLAEAHFQHERPAPSVQTLLAALAVSTVGLRLGAAGKVLPLDSPVRVAEDFAVIDLMSNGRLIFGAAAGDDPDAFRVHHVPFAEREDRFREALDLILHAWTADAFRYAGRFFEFPAGAKPSEQNSERFSPVPPPDPYPVPWKRAGQKAAGLPVLPKPVQFPHPPVWRHGSNEEEARFAAARGLTFLPPPFISIDRAERLLFASRTAIDEACRDLREVEVPLIREVFVAEDEARAEAVARGPMMDLYGRAQADGRLARWEGRPIEPGELSWEALRSTRVVVGGVEEVTTRLREIQTRLGVRHILCHMSVPGIPPAEISAAMRLFQAEVWTRLQG